MMKTSFSTLACPDWTLSKVIDAAAKYSYDGIELRVISRELDLWKLPAFKPSSLPATRAAIECRGLAVVAANSSACFHSPDAAERERNFDSALRMAEIAAGLGARAIRVFGDTIQPSNSRADTARWIADSLLRLADELKPTGVQVWLETHGDFSSAADVGNLFALLGRNDIGIIWDPANAFDRYGEMPNISSTMAPRIRHVHLKDLSKNSKGLSRFVLTGEGDFPFNQMFDSLAAIGFDGFVSFEWEKQWHPELAPPDEALPHFIQWLKSRKSA